MKNYGPGCFRVFVKTAEDIINFAKMNERCNFEIDASSGRYVVDAKSIMGLFSMDTSNPITVTIHTDNPAKMIEYEKELQRIFSDKK